MPYLKSLPLDAGPPAIFVKYPEIYGPWATMSQAMMNGPSPLSQGERELVLAYAAAVAGCDFVHVAHAEVAYQWGIERGLVERLLKDPDSPGVDSRLKALLGYVRKLMLSPPEITQSDVDAVLDAGWDEQAVHDAIAITGRAAFMQRLTQGMGFTPMDPDMAAKRAKKRIEHGYVDLYSAFREKK